MTSGYIIANNIPSNHYYVPIFNDLKQTQVFQNENNIENDLTRSNEKEVLIIDNTSPSIDKKIIIDRNIRETETLKTKSTEKTVKPNDIVKKVNFLTVIQREMTGDIKAKLISVNNAKSIYMKQFQPSQ